VRTLWIAPLLVAVLAFGVAGWALAEERGRLAPAGPGDVIGPEPTTPPVGPAQAPRPDPPASSPLWSAAAPPAGPPAVDPGGPVAGPLRTLVPDDPKYANPAGNPDPAGAVQVSPPVSVIVPAIDVLAPVDPLATDPHGVIEVPADPDRTGWWVGGPEPGEPGAAVVLGHVDSWQGPGVFAALHTLAVGDEVRVLREDGSVAVFAVTGGRLYGKDEFPTDRVYGWRDPQPALRLVTCGGAFDRATRSYEANFVVYATLSHVEPAPAAPPGPRPLS